jgi:hypothetical protein
LTGFAFTSRGFLAGERRRTVGFLVFISPPEKPSLLRFISGQNAAARAEPPVEFRNKAAAE